MPDLKNVQVKIFADGADLEIISKLAQNPLVRGFTTNPSLMRKAGVVDYKAFALDVLSIVPDRSVSLEVFSDEFEEMENQALEIASWGGNVYVKIPVTNTRGDFSGPLIERLSSAGVQVNVTAVFTSDMVGKVVNHLSEHTSSIVSVFAGRIANTGLDPIPIMAKSVELLKARPKAELLWASPRELLNIFHADSVGCHIITVTSEIIATLQTIGKDLDSFSLDTVKMFRQDALAAGYLINLPEPAVMHERANQ